MSTLSCRERVLMAVNLEQPDRVPMDIWAEDEVWDRLLRDLGASTRDQVCERLQTDIRYILPTYPGDTLVDGMKQNMWGERWARTDTAWGETWEHVDGALAGATCLADLESFPWPSCDDVDYSTIAQQCDRFEGYAIAHGFADTFERPAMVRGLANMLCDTVLHPDWVDYLVKVFLDFYVEDFHRCLEASRGRMDIFWAITDLGSQDRMLVSQACFGRFIAPALRTMAGAAHREGVKFMFHSCGAVRDVIPSLIEIGVDILNPIQPACAGMAPEGLKRDFGKNLCFHGGVDVQYLLPGGTPEAIGTEVHRTAGILGAGGGAILAPSNNLQPDTSTQNILAMYEPELRYI